MEKFEEIYRLYNRDVYRLTYSYVLNKLDAEDITQKTFYKFYINIKHLSIPNEEIKKWLFRVAINESKNLLKSSWHKIFRVQNDKPVKDEGKEVDNSLIDILKNVSPKNRSVLYLFYHEGYEIKEISKIIKKSPSAVKMRLSRGREEIKKEMEDFE